MQIVPGPDVRAVDHHLNGYGRNPPGVFETIAGFDFTAGEGKSDFVYIHRLA